MHELWLPNEQDSNAKLLCFTLLEQRFAKEIHSPRDHREQVPVNYKVDIHHTFNYHLTGCPYPVGKMISRCDGFSFETQGNMTDIYTLHGILSAEKSRLE